MWSLTRSSMTFPERIVFAKLLSQRAFIKLSRNSSLHGTYWQQPKNLWWWVDWIFSWEKEDFNLNQGKWMLECHIHNGGDTEAHVFWGSEAFLIAWVIPWAGSVKTLMPLGPEKACYYHLKMEISSFDSLAEWRILWGFSSHQVWSHWLPLRLTCAGHTFSARQIHTLPPRNLPLQGYALPIDSYD